MEYTNGRGYYVLFGSMLDMVRENKPLKIGTVAYKESRGYGHRTKRLSYLREKNGNYIRLYEVRHHHKYYSNEEKVRDKFPEFFI